MSPQFNLKDCGTHRMESFDTSPKPDADIQRPNPKSTCHTAIVEDQEIMHLDTAI